MQLGNRADKADSQNAELRESIAHATKQREQLRIKHLGLLREATEKADALAQQRSALGEVLQAIAATEKSIEGNRDSEQSARKSAELAAWP
ncbi:MAG: hypothetical protein R3C53_11305 [Pirellulaceae bacterium]